MAILAVLLYTPSDLDKTSLLEGFFVQILDDKLFIVVEDEVVGNESLDDHFTRLISVMIASKFRCSDQWQQHQRGGH